MRAATSSSLNVALTPTLMLGANTIGTRCAAASIRARPASSKPVVPMTAPTPLRTQASRWARVPSGRVKSIRKSAPARASSADAVIATPVLRPRNSPASRPSAGLPASSSAPARLMSSASSAASMSIRPMRPVEPAIATLSPGIVALLGDAGSCVASRAVAGQGRVARVFDLRQGIGIDLRDAVVLEHDDYAPQFGVAVRMQVAKDVVPAIRFEHVDEQGRAEGEADLLGTHARLDLVEHLAGQVVALGQVDAVRLEDAAATGIARRAGAERETAGQDQDQRDPGREARSGMAACMDAGIRHGNVDIGWLGGESHYDKRSRTGDVGPGPVPTRTINMAPPPCAGQRTVGSMPESTELKSAGLKATLPRLKILEVFHTGRQRHMSAEDVFKKLLAENHEIGLATVYRVLTQFEQAGLLKRSNFESGKAVFELDQGDHHDHLVCLRCG